ncbi:MULTISPECIES: carboxymuconolactone decarboxylase family protein [unclassified Actinopolyspora]|uniref:carboxymuconolactone decarboxylase family protein n=1 Tax=unclassified Actinopolyspora TaxID=2639451 RepID=UPI0013F69E36|nr:MULTISPECIES: carboxymuconolactone decarboxylase family protein [unclassified Actinopolyspora]NHD15989.1 carboxymuconolactone decarboxylase family protein [Actinopolyspora sp. BKK2]NHE74797.1 carboxymuconolactone decarboxylase family protein [Actinopolyspora sp. BKK1]
MPRIPYPDEPSLPEPARTALERMVAPLNLIRMCAHATTLVGPLIKLSTALLSRLHLSARHRELLILRTARNTRCDYVLAQHEVIAREIGMTEEEIAATRRTDPGFRGTAERELLDAADELVERTTLDPERVASLLSSFDHAQLVELFLLVGHYRMLAGLLNGLAVDIDPRGEKFVELANHRPDSTKQQESG